MKLHSSMTALLLGGAAAAATGYAWSQGFLGSSLPNPAGTEQISVRPLTSTGSQAATEAVIQLNQIRNATGYLLIGNSASATGTITLTSATDELLLNVAPNTATYVLPAKGLAFDAEQFQFCNVTGTPISSATPVTLAAGASTSISQGASNSSTIAVGTLAANACVELVYSNNTNDWYRIR